MTGLQTGKPASDIGYLGVEQTIAQRITVANSLTTIVNDMAKKLPAYAHVTGGGVHVVTAFNDSGTDTLDVGFRGGSSTDDDNAYATLLDLSAVGYIVLDELATTTNIMQTKDTILTFRYNGQNSNASAGDAYLIIKYVVAGP
jgi:hypothetical protein